VASRLRVVARSGRGSVLAGPAGAARRLRLLREAARVGQRGAEQVVDLGVRAAQLVGGPPRQGVVDRRVEPQQHGLAVGHRSVQRAGVDDRLRPPVAAEDDEQVADHRGLALLVELDDPALGSGDPYFGDQNIFDVFKEALATVDTEFAWGPTMTQVYTDIGDQFSKVATGKGTLPAALDAVQDSTVSTMKSQGISVR